MKVLFIENRHKTFFYEPIAQHLQNLGHEIFWLIQNNRFKPKGKFETKFINYPKPNNLEKYKPCERIEDIIKSDRQQNFFFNKDTSYFYYYDQEINKYLLELNPKIVFGESTAFHELIAIKNCIQLDILYLNPSTCRYPVGRFSFYKYNTLEPYKGSGEVYDDLQAGLIIDQIVNRKTPPDYMKIVSNSRREVFKDHIIKINSYVTGETFNTPNPFIKFKLEKNRKKNIRRWDISSFKSIENDPKFKILYPLQMQPEANIDVWGRKYRNQTELVDAIAKSLPKNTVLYVKPNPKSKYELSPELISLVEHRTNIKHLHHGSKMTDVFPNVDLVITVTGTIAIECILSNKPVITLVKTINNKARNCRYVDEIQSELTPIIEEIKNNNFTIISNQEKVSFINLLTSTSFKGIISDPFTDYKCVSNSNIEDLNNAFVNVLSSINISL